MTVDRSREDKGRAYYTQMEGKKERKMIGRVVLLHLCILYSLPLCILKLDNNPSDDPGQDTSAYLDGDDNDDNDDLHTLLIEWTTRPAHTAGCLWATTLEHLPTASRASALSSSPLH